MGYNIHEHVMFIIPLIIHYYLSEHSGIPAQIFPR